MKTKSVVIGIYAALILAGGLIGYLVAGSFASLISGGLSGLLLLVCSFFVWKQNLIAYDASIGIMCALLVFFCYRFLSTHQIAPAGVLGLITMLLLIYLGRQRQEHNKKIRQM